jgi:hypothetical protein
MDGVPPINAGNSMGERRRYRRVKIRLPLAFTVLESDSEVVKTTGILPEGEKISGETYDISMEGLTIDTMLSAQDMGYLMPVIAKTQKGPRIDVSVEVEGETVSMAGTVIWYNLFFPGTPPPNFKAGLYLIEPDSNPSKQKWNEFLDAIKV